MENICQLQKLARMIAMKNTGSRNRLAEIYSVNERTITNWIKYLEQLYFLEIRYSRSRNTYLIIDGELPKPLYLN